MISWISLLEKIVYLWETSYIRLFHHQYFNLSFFCDKLRNNSECGEVTAQNRWNMFLTTGFEETEFNTSFNGGTAVRTIICLRDFAQVLKVQIIVLFNSDDFLFRPIGKSLRTDVTPYQTEPIHSAYFHDIYKAVKQQVFFVRDSKVVWNDNSKHLPRSFLWFL